MKNYKDLIKIRELRKHRFGEEGNWHNVEELLHGYCDLFLAYFLERNPEWHGEYIIRNSNRMIVHAYAVCEVEDETILYADARGVFSCKKDFFKPYRFREKDVHFTPQDESMRAECLERMKEKKLESAIEQAYQLVFG